MGQPVRRIFEYYNVLSQKEFEIMKLTVTGAVSKIGIAAVAHSIDSSSSKAGNMLGTIGTAAIRSK